MKNFDLEAAKAGDKVVSASGQPVRIMCFDMQQTMGLAISCLCAEGVFKEEAHHCVDLNGDNVNTGFSLYMAPVKHQAWVNVYRNENGVYTPNTRPYQTEEEAIEGASPSNYIKSIMIHEWEE